MTEEQRDKRRASNRASNIKYRERNRQKIREQHKQHYKENRDEIAARRAKARHVDIQATLKKEQAYRLDHRDEINDRMNDRRYKVKRECLAFLGGMKCHRCGFTSDCPAQFDFHHKDRTAKLFGISAKISNGFLFPALTDELVKCIVVCSNCHALLHYKGETGNVTLFAGDHKMQHDL
jgi:hypothetical protein